MSDAPKFVTLGLLEGYVARRWERIVEVSDDEPETADYIRLDLHEAAIMALKTERDALGERLLECACCDVQAQVSLAAAIRSRAKMENEKPVVESAKPTG